VTQPPIGDYGLIGDARTAALCSSAGSIDWLCFPQFDSDPVFGRLIGGDRAGCFAIEVDGVRRTLRRYRDDSAVLETTWTTDGAEVRLTEGMVVDVSSTLLPQLVLVRRIEAQGGPARIRVLFDPRAGLAGEPLPSRRRWDTILASRGSLLVGLRTDLDVGIVPGREANLVVHPQTPVTFVLTAADREPLVLLDAAQAWTALEETDRWWKRWTQEIDYEGPAAGSIARSFITLRLLIYAPSGAPVAAPTTSLPEVIGGPRNWDYRFSWPRDASTGLTAFLEMGRPDEAHAFMHWLLHAGRMDRPRLDVLYTLFGQAGPAEEEHREMPGYRDSRPVRIGNRAKEQHQLDVYGWVLDAAKDLAEARGRLHGETWRGMSKHADFIAANWRRPDAGIWEVRGEPRHYVHSKLMGWVGLERALYLTRSHHARRGRSRRWRSEQRALADDIRDRGFDPARGSYVWYYGADALDAALLLMPWTEFEDPGSPRVTGTIDAVRRELGAGGPLLFRVPPGQDGLEGREGAFLACSFWLVDALARTGRRDEAVEVFEDMCGRANELGLFAEEMDPSTGEHLGNFPQGLTHAAMLHAARTLQLKGRGPADGQDGLRKVPSRTP
jgi:pentatricopeptide repeat protein